MDSDNSICCQQAPVIMIPIKPVTIASKISNQAREYDRQPARARRKYGKSNMKQVVHHSSVARGCADMRQSIMPAAMPPVAQSSKIASNR
jgi:hypothetical protein